MGGERPISTSSVLADGPANADVPLESKHEVTAKGGNIAEQNEQYPSGMKLAMIGFGLGLAVICSNLVMPFPSVSHH
jgi:hypothetical protein